MDKKLIFDALQDLYPESADEHIPSRKERDPETYEEFQAWWGGPELTEQDLIDAAARTEAMRAQKQVAAQQREAAEGIRSALYAEFKKLSPTKQQKFRRNNFKLQLKDALEDASNGDPEALAEAIDLIGSATPADGVETDAKAKMLAILRQEQ